LQVHILLGKEMSNFCLFILNIWNLYSSLEINISSLRNKY
jgi:hypothetical protein